MQNLNLKLSRDELHDFARAMTAEMGSEDFRKKLQEALSKRESLPTTEDEFISFFEELQEEFLTQYAKMRQTTNGLQGNEENKSNTVDPQLDGALILKELKEAVLHYPDSETESLIMRMCMLHKTLMESMCATTPGLAASLQHHNQQHSHDHCHSHGGSECHGHGTPNMQQMQEMQMAVQSLSPALREDMMRIQQKMFTGQQPTQEDMKKAETIQKHIMAFIATLRQFNNSSESAANKN